MFKNKLSAYVFFPIAHCTRYFNTFFRKLNWNFTVRLFHVYIMSMKFEFMCFIISNTLYCDHKWLCSINGRCMRVNINSLFKWKWCDLEHANFNECIPQIKTIIRMPSFVRYGVFVSAFQWIREVYRFNQFYAQSVMFWNEMKWKKKYWDRIKKHIHISTYIIYGMYCMRYTNTCEW